MKTEKIKAFISDPQVLFREGIHFTLSGEDDFEVTGETTNNEDAFSHIEDNPPTVAILNMKDAKLNGPEITCRIKRNFPSVSVILIMDSEGEEHLFAALKCGASACLSKDTDPEYLVDIIREVVQGARPITQALLMPEVASNALAEFEALSPLSEQLNNLLARLSPGETEVLNCIAAGNGIDKVAASLNITEEAIREHLESIANKLVANDQSKALIESTQRNLPSIISSAAAAAGRPAADYVTKTEFNEFKETLMQRFKSFIGELS